MLKLEIINGTCFADKKVSMNCAKYLFSIFLGTLIYVSLSLSVGQNSLKCYSQLEEQKILLSKRTSEIQNINSELNLELTALKNDKAVIAAYARKLDYVQDGEKLVKITGLKPAQNALYDTGTILRYKKPVYLSEKICKIISFFITMLCMAVMLLSDISSGKLSFGKSEKTAVKGIPVYDFKQI